MEYQLKLKKDQQIASGSVKLLQHWKKWRGVKLQVCQPGYQQQWYTSYRRYWNSVVIGFM